ncbi:tail fiber protein [Aquimarina pacifica]|uniref:tail fiber protein n=1 Tax=Aquimarina pacifica TaxID=1296415 RepID=UPI0004704E3F|nr:tail fiber protein [Aquimarina pacifica]
MNKIWIFSALLINTLMALAQTNQIIDKEAATIYLGQNGDSGPHGIVFDDNISGEGLQIFYRTTPNALIIEKTSDNSDLFSIDYDTEYGYFNGRVGIGSTEPESMLQIGNSATVNNSNYITFGKRLSTVEVNLPFMGHDSFVDRNDLGLGTRSTSGRINFYTGNSSSSFDKNQIRMTIKADGNVGIGTSSPDMKLTVKGKIHAEEVKIDLNVPAPDYVFDNNYNLRSLEEVEGFIINNSHLPEIPSAKEFEQNGVMLAEMNMNLLKKVEELTLYTIQQQKDIKKLQKENEQLNLLNEKLLELYVRLEKLESKQ